MMFGGLALLVLLGFGLWWFMQQQNGDGPNTPPSAHDDPAEIARLRYARGEISKEQYDEIRRTLG